jgi:precorrin-6Y C5,15-methyltransferase (decarboxylating)
VKRAVTVVGIGDDGCVGLSARAAAAIDRAQVLAGGERHLGFFPDNRARRVVLGQGLTRTLADLAGLADEHDICILASGDPLFFGIGGLCVKAFGGEHVEFLPQPSAMQLAFARAGTRWDDARLVSVHGRPLAGLAVKARRYAKLAVFTDEENHPARIAAHLLEYGVSDLSAVVCENLAGPGERVRRFQTLSELAGCQDIAPLNVLLLLRATTSSPAIIPWLDEETFAKRLPKKGLITKREVRALSIAALRLRKDSVVWDVGAGSGSVAIEAGLLAEDGAVYAVETDPEGVAICEDNVRRHGTDHVRVIHGRAPAALQELPAPDAVFVGGSKGELEAIVQLAWSRLSPGGRLVVNAITLDNVGEAYKAFRGLGVTPELLLVQISRGAPLADYLRYEAHNPIHVFFAEKPR